jgi:hypothetical protein
MSMTNFNAIAAARGDGLDPRLRELLERAAMSAHSEVVVRADGMLQAGPNPRSPGMETVSAAGANIVPGRTMRTADRGRSAARSR